ncbi:MAG: nucleotide exchange factor GrpE [Candidatus Desantisbacteria bacterium]
MDKEVNGLTENEGSDSKENPTANKCEQPEESKNAIKEETPVDANTQVAEVKTVTEFSEEKEKECVEIEVEPEKPEEPSAILSSPESIALLQEIKATIERKIAYDETKEKMFNTLYEQLKGYQGEFLDAFKKPIIKSLVTLYDDTIKVEKVINEESCGEKVKSGINALKVELLEILENMEVMPFCEHPDVLNYKLQKTIKTVETIDPAEDKRVVEVLREGFLWKGNILRPEDVVIKKYAGQQNQ